MLALGGKKPQDAGYPILMEFGFVYKAEKLTAGVKQFVDFVLSPAGLAIIKASSAFPVSQ